MEALLVRIKASLKRSNNIPKSVAVNKVLTQDDSTLIPETYSIEINGQQTKVTPIEFDIVNLLMQNYGNMVSSSKILNDVWGYSADDAVETIRVHMRHIRTKIDKISSGKKYIETIYGGGYRLVPTGVDKK
jgi:two-component system response regulator RpaA